MPNFYIISDVHGFYDEMIYALDKAGFNPDDENSWLISLGDEMDRGPEPEKVINYIMSLPRAIWVRGNHQSLFEDMISRGYPLPHDRHNGTMQSMLSLAPNAKELSTAFAIAYEKTKPFFDKAIDYFELRNHIFVHSFIPLNGPDWRHAHASDWEKARWDNPYELAHQGFLPDKTLVFGHYHTSWPRYKYDGEPAFGKGANFDIYYGDGYIGIDACTAYSRKVNCLVIEDDFLEG